MKTKLPCHQLARTLSYSLCFGAPLQDQAEAGTWLGIAYLFGFFPFPVLLLTLPSWFLQRTRKAETKTAFRWVTGPNCPGTVQYTSEVQLLRCPVPFLFPLPKLVHIELLSFAVKRDLINSTTETPSSWNVVWSKWLFCGICYQQYEQFMCLTEQIVGRVYIFQRWLVNSVKMVESIFILWKLQKWLN